MNNWIVVLNDGETYTDAAGCTLRVITPEQTDQMESGGDASDIGAPLATYKIESLPRIVDLVTQAEALLNDHLIDNTEDVFEELPDIDTARAALNDALDLIGVGETTK